MTTYSGHHKFTGVTDPDTVLIALYSLGRRADSTTDIYNEIIRLGLPPVQKNNTSTAMTSWSRFSNPGVKIEYRRGRSNYTDIRLVHIDTDIERQIINILAERKQADNLRVVQPIKIDVQPIGDRSDQSDSAQQIANAVLSRIGELLEIEEKIENGEFNVDKITALENTVEQGITENNQLLEMIRSLNDELATVKHELERLNVASNNNVAIRQFGRLAIQ